ncbi:histidine phosphatase family protein [Sagittula sp. S175]|uniref:histidine phosphatase family protein n=1 Tax=Sagittula sp. S175 TaxID=3415129 RepID=UPI003C7B914C
MRLPKSIVLLRHGRTAWNRADTLIGQKDIPLDDGGRHDARSAIRFLTGIDAIYSSPLSRCKETAEIIGAALGLEIVFLDGLKERHWGIYEGRPKRERDKYKDPEGGETIDDFRARVEQEMLKIGNVRPLLVTHSGVIRLLLDRPNASIPHAVPLEMILENVYSVKR